MAFSLKNVCSHPNVSGVNKLHPTETLNGIDPAGCLPPERSSPRENCLAAVRGLVAGSQWGRVYLQNWGPV